MTIRTDLQKKVQNNLIQYAFFRWENAIVIALTILLFALYPMPMLGRLGWLLLGAIGVGAIAYTSLNDAETNARMLLTSFQEQFNPGQISDRQLRKEVEDALEYQRRIEEQIREQREGVMRDRLENTAGQIANWIGNVYELALRLDAYYDDALLAREKEMLPREIKQLEARRKLESNATVQNELDQTLNAKGKHWQSIRALDNRMKQADLQLDQSLTALATIYSQVQLIGAKDVNSGRTERLQADIREQVDRLDDLVDSINQVYDYHTKGLG